MPLMLNAKNAIAQNGVVTALTPAGIKQVLRRVADMRTAMQRRREKEMLSPVRAYAQTKGWKVVPYLGRHIELHDDVTRIRIDMALGVPTSRDLERAFQAASAGIPGGSCCMIRLASPTARPIT